MPLFPWCGVLSTWINLHCFLNLFSLFTFTGDFEVDLCLMVAAVTLLALLFETGIITVKSEGICLVTYTSARQSWYDEHDGHADDFFFFLNIWPDKVWIDWRTKPPCMNRSILETLLYSAWTDICTAHEGRLNTMISRFGKEDICPMVGEALPCEQAPLYLHSLFVCHVFCLRVISFALMCNANESLIGNWH